MNGKQNGCLQEYQIAEENKCIIIPLGTTGDAAASIYDTVKAAKPNYPYLESYWEILRTETNLDNLVNAVISIAKNQRSV